MFDPNERPLIGKLIVVVLLLATPAIAFFLIASTATADTGPVGWLLFVIVPLALLGTGIYLVARGAWDDGTTGSGSEFA